MSYCGLIINFIGIQQLYAIMWVYGKPRDPLVNHHFSDQKWP